MKKITKKQIKSIRKGSYETLSKCIEFLVDNYTVLQWDRGYRSCLEDTSLEGQRLAEYLIDANRHREWTVLDGSCTKLAKVIEDYFKEALKQ